MGQQNEYQPKGGDALRRPVARILEAGEGQLTTMGGKGHGERGARAYNGGLGRSPQRGPGAEPLVRESGGKAPPEAERFSALECPKDAAFFGPSWEFLELKKTTDIG